MWHSMRPLSVYSVVERFGPDGSGRGKSVVAKLCNVGRDVETLRLCLSEIKSGHIRDATRRGPSGKEYALPSLRCAIGEHPCPKRSACASHYSGERSARFQNPAQTCLAQETQFKKSP
jgi:hypothetical protein